MRVKRTPSRGAWGRLARAVGLGLAHGCGAPASLDAIGPSPSSSGTSPAALTGTTTGTSADDSASAGDAPPDVHSADLPELPPPPGECPLECTIELPLVWAWDDETRAPPDPPDPVIGGRLCAMVQAQDGSWIVATQRDGQPWLTRIDPQGALLSSTPAWLGCDCEIVDLALYPSGEIAVLGEGTFDDFYVVLTLARVEPSTMTLFAQTWDIIDGTSDRPARVGSVVPIDDEYVTVVVTESSVNGEGTALDSIRLFIYQYGNLDNLIWIDTQLAIGPPRRPQGILSPSGDLVITIPGAGGMGMDDYVAWIDPVTSFPLAIQSLPGQADAMAVDPSGALVVAGHALPSPESLELQATRLPRLLPPAWQFSTDAPSPGTSLPVLAVDALGHPYLAARTTAGDPADASVMLVRLSTEGTPTWSTTLPLPVEASPSPLALAITDDPDPDLVIAAFVDGHLHLERREQACACD